MNSIILFFDGEVRSIEDLFIAIGGQKQGGRRIMLEKSNSWLSIDKLSKPFCDYDELERETILSLIDNPTALLIEWRNDEILQDIFEKLSLDNNIVVDNDHGLICTLLDLKGLHISKWIREKTR